MFERMKWEEVYQLWKHGAYYFPQSLSTPLPIEKVAVEYSGGGYFYGYQTQDGYVWARLQQNHDFAAQSVAP